MSIVKEKINGKLIETSIKSTSIKSAIYDTLLQKLTITFNGGQKYSYKDVPIQVFTKFRMAKSQGQYFNKNISPFYEYKKTK